MLILLTGMASVVVKTQKELPVRMLMRKKIWCGWPKPGSYLTRVMCVSEELLEPCTFRTTPLWTNDGGWENDRGSVWEIDGSISRFWYANKGWDSLPNTGRAFCLKEPEFIPDTE